MSTATTYQAVADRTGTDIPAHLVAQAEPPLVTHGRQGDVMVMAIDLDDADMEHAHKMAKSRGKKIAGEGVNVVEGDVGRNRHILSTAIGGESWFMAGRMSDGARDYGMLFVAEGETAELTHTGEHGTLSFEPGAYRVFGQMDVQTARRVAD